MDEWLVVVDKSPWLEMLKNAIASGPLVRTEGGLTARSHILVSWSVYTEYEYHYFSMYLVHLWLVEITCRMECISAPAK